MCRSHSLLPKPWHTKVYAIDTLSARCVPPFTGDVKAGWQPAPHKKRSLRHELADLAAGHGDLGALDPGADVRVRGRLRQSLEGAAMIVLTAVVTVLLFIYLLAALLRPEWF
jgi:K+-transporting ATPase KdpF subunit